VEGRDVGDPHREVRRGFRLTGELLKREHGVVQNGLKREKESEEKKRKNRQVGRLNDKHKNERMNCLGNTLVRTKQPTTNQTHENDENLFTATRKKKRKKEKKRLIFLSNNNPRPNPPMPLTYLHTMHDIRVDFFTRDGAKLA
jgi:hypothetical protein